MNRLAIFDCDGTLVDSQHNICAAMEACFAAAGLERPARAGAHHIAAHPSEIIALTRAHA